MNQVNVAAWMQKNATVLVVILSVLVYVFILVVRLLIQPEVRRIRNKSEDVEIAYEVLF